MGIKQDYIARLIEEFAQVMRVMLGLKTEGKSLELFAAIENAMTDFTGIKFSTISDMEVHYVVPFLKEQKTLSKEHWIIICDLLMLSGEVEVEKNNSTLGLKHLSKALEIAKFIDQIEIKIFSIQHSNKLSQLKNRVEELSN